MAVICGECSKELADLKALSDHYKELYDHKLLKSFKCAYCQKRMMDKRTLVRHITTYHIASSSGDDSSATTSSNEAGTSSLGGPQGNEQGNFTSTLSSHGDNSEINDDIVCDAHVDCVVVKPVSVQEAVDNAAVNVLVNLRSTASLSGKAIERFEKGCSDMIQDFCSSLKTDLNTKLKDKGMSNEDIADVLRVVQVENPFRHLKTIDDQLNYFKEKFGLVPPKELYLDHRTDKRLDPKLNVYVPSQVKETFQYVSIIGTLKAILADKKMRNLIFKDFVAKDGVLTSYVNGSNFKDHPFLLKHKVVLHILLYYDELETANALGSKTIIHKLGAFFFQILNFPAELLSKMSSIHLLDLVNADDMKKPGAFKKVLTPFIQDMKRLSSDEGVPIVTDDGDFTMRAVLVALTADTAAAHDLCGFLGPGARHFCRRCMVSRAEVRADANAMGPLRTEEQHQYHLEQVQRSKKFQTECGVKRPCPLDQIPYFSCVNNVAFDAFHDLLEGVVPLVLKLVLREYIVIRKLFTVKDLNSNIASFSYGIPDSKNKPSPNFTDDMFTKRSANFKQTGSQMWCLARCLPFLIADFLPDGVDLHMKLLFLLQDIMQIIFSFEIPDGDVETLDVLVFDHNELFFKLFIAPQTQEGEDFLEDSDDEPEEVSNEEPKDDDDDVTEDVDDEAQEEGSNNEVSDEAQEEEEVGEGEILSPLKVHVINKLHHLKHYSEMIRRLGNPVRMWCAKFEGRLKIFRQHSAVCCCFKNPPKTMAKMFQLSNLKSIKSDLFDDDTIEHQKAISVRVKESLYKALLINENLQDEDVVSMVNSAIVKGEEYRSGLFVCLPGSTRLQPKFALINDVILVDEKSVILIVKSWENLGRSAKFNTYHVSPEKVKVLLQ